MKNKCKLTMSQEHIWFKKNLSTGNILHDWVNKNRLDLYYPVCVACGMIDDREGKT